VQSRELWGKAVIRIVGIRRWSVATFVTAVATVGLTYTSIAEPDPSLQPQISHGDGTSTQEASWFALAGPYAITAPDAITTAYGSFVVQMTETGFFNIVRQLPGGAWSGTGNSRPNGDLPQIEFSSRVVVATPLDGPPPGTAVDLFDLGQDRAMYGLFVALTTVFRDIWAPLGGGFISQPEAVSFGGVTYMFGVGLDGAVWYSSRLGAGGEWLSLGGRIVSDLSVTTDGKNLHVFGIGLDGAMWSRSSHGLSWSPWQSLGGGFLSSPVSASADGHAYVFAIGLDEAVWWWSSEPGRRRWHPAGGRAMTAPAVAADPHGGVNVFVVGIDGAMWQTHLAAAASSPWMSLGGGFTSAPAATSTHVLGIGLDGWLYGATY